MPGRTRFRRSPASDAEPGGQGHLVTRRAAAFAGLLAAGLLAGCSGSSTSPAARPAPSPTVPASGYTALGDSYSSGDGVGDYEPGSAVAGDECHRSSVAYAPLLDSARALGKLTFAACAGAVTNDLVSANHENYADPQNHVVEPAQISEIPPHAKTVTLTIGGNDAGFSSVLESCVLGRVGPVNVFPHLFGSFSGCHGSATLNRTLNTRLQALAGATQTEAEQGTPIIAVADLLSRIHLRAPQAHIYLVGYPLLFGDTKSSCRVGNVDVEHVPLLGTVTTRLTVSAADATWLNVMAGKLNAVLRTAAGTRSSASFVDVSATFAGHRLCDTGVSWIAPVSGTADLRAKTSGLAASSFHPTRAGQSDGYEAALIAAGVG